MLAKMGESSMNDQIRISRHGETRMQQRGISKMDILIVHEYGTSVDNEAVLLLSQDVDREVRHLQRQIRRVGSAASDVKDCRETIRALERNRDRKIVMAGDLLVTAYRPRRADQKRALRISRTKGYSK